METKEYFQQESQELRKELNKALEKIKLYELMLHTLIGAVVEYNKVDENNGGEN